MAKTFAKLPCPRCAYQAISQVDLDGHTAQVHPGGVASAQAPIPRPVAPVPVAPTVAASRPTHPALQVPQADETFWVDDKVARLLLSLEKLARKGQPVNILLTGPTGTGKSTLPKEFAAWSSRPFYTVHCQLIAEVDDWWGSRELSLERGTFFDKAAFLDAVETEGCVILLDEANRTPSNNLNALFGFLDHRQRAWVPQLKRDMAVASGVVFFATLNEGYEYLGTNGVDRALRDRMTYSIRMGYVPKRVEKEILRKRTGVAEDVAEKLAEFGRSVRRNPKLSLAVSTRQLLGAASLVAEGLALPDAVLFSVVNNTPEDVDRQALLQALQVIGDVDDAYVKGEEADDDADTTTVTVP